MTRIFSFLAVLALLAVTGITQTQAAPKRAKEFRLTPPIPASQYNTQYKESDVGLEKHRIFLLRGFGYAIYSYHRYTPKTLKPGKKNPAIILMHGAGRSGIAMAEMWKKSAERHNIQIFAPTGQGHQWFRDNAADNAMMVKLINEIKDDPSIDPTQIYIFGHSDGAGAALWLGAAQSEDLAAVAIHAGSIRDKGHLSAIKAAKRKIPYCLLTGTYDSIFPIKHVRYAAQMIAYEGHDTVFTEIIGHNHWYYTLADWVNEAAWSCMTSMTKK